MTSHRSRLFDLQPLETDSGRDRKQPLPLGMPLPTSEHVTEQPYYASDGSDGRENGDHGFAWFTSWKHLLTCVQGGSLAVEMKTTQS